MVTTPLQPLQHAFAQRGVSGEARRPYSEAMSNKEPTMTCEREARIHDAARRRADELRNEALDRAWQRALQWLKGHGAPGRTMQALEA